MISLLGTVMTGLIGLVGIFGAVILFFVGLANKDDKKMKRAVIIFIGTWLLVLLVGLIRFLLFM
jgi:hypothetical protein